MRLDRLTLTNFKGARNLTLESNGQDVTVLGDNGTGKTTLADAFAWLVSDKDSTNKKDFEVKTLDENNNPIPGLSHEVEGVLILGSRKLTLKKVYTEKFTKKRGTAQAQFTGNTTDYFIDGVPKPKKEYDACVAGIADESTFKLLTNPTYFSEQLHWAKRREILLTVCGDLTDADVIASDKKLSKLKEIIPAGRTLDDHKQVIAARRAEINKELDRIPVRIDEATRALPDLTGIQSDRIPTELASLKDRKKEKEQERARIENGGEIADREKQLAQIDGELLQLQNAHRTQQDEKTAELRKKLNAKKIEAGVKEADIAGLKRSLDFNNNEIMALESKRDKLRTQWHQVNDQPFEFSQDPICPTCGQELPESMIAEARKRALEAFNLSKSTQLEKINADGKAAKDKSEVLQAEATTLKASIDKASEELRQINVVAEDITSKIKAIQELETPIPGTPEYKQKLQSKSDIEKIITQLRAGNQEALNKVDNQIADLNIAIASMDNGAAKVKRHADGQKRIEELNKQERTLAAEYEKLENENYLCEQFIVKKVNLLEEKINSRFRYARFKLFNRNINGGIEPCCEVLYRGIPYSSNLNAGHKIIIGLDIIRTLSEYYGFKPPVFVDNAESVTDLPDMDAQVIRLIKPEIKDDEDRAKYGRLVVKVSGKEQTTLREAV